MPRRIKDPAQLKQAVRDYQAYFDALKRSFVGRDDLIELLKYALALRQHVLVFGPPGTAKTAVCDRSFEGITGAEKFHTELSMFMTDDALFGPYDPKRMREDGVLEHRIDGMLPRANFARLGEFLDANMATLRSLLSALHERRMRRGAQVVDMPLLTVYCDTNVSPRTYLEKNQNAWAVIDRLLFITYVGYLEEAPQIAEMLDRFQTGKVTQVTKTIGIDLIHDLSDLVVLPPSLIRNKMLYRFLAEAFVAYRTERRKQIIGAKSGDWKEVILPDITDRRFALATQVAEAAAVFDGRFEVVPKDILPIKLVLGTTHSEHRLWERLANEAIERYEEERHQQLDHAQLGALDGLDAEVKSFNGGSNGDLNILTTAIGDIRVRLDGIVPENDKVSQRKAEVQAALSMLTEAAKERLLRENNLS